jgi:hypothetical protein
MKKHILLVACFFVFSNSVPAQNADTTYIYRKIFMLGFETAGSGRIPLSDKSPWRYSTLLWGARLGGFVTPYLGVGLTGTYVHHNSNFIKPPDDIYQVGWFARLYSPSLRVFKPFGRKKKKAFECELYLEFQHERATATFTKFEDIRSDKRLKYNIYHFLFGSSTRVWRNLKLDYCLQAVWYPESPENRRLQTTARLGLDYFFTKK